MDRVRIGMLGCGLAADLYMPIFRYVKECELVAVVDINKDSAQEMAAKYRVKKIYTDVKKAAKDRDIDAFVIGTPPNLHAEHTEVLAKEGKHILCEKPMASTVSDCQRIIDACRKSKVKLQMGHMKRFMRGNQKVKALVDSGILGKIFMAECHWDCAVPGLIGTYREKTTTGGGSLQDHGPHAFDLIRWWTASDILQVSASIRIVHPQRPTEDMVVVTLEHENGIVSFYHLTVFLTAESTGRSYRIYGTNGTLVVRNNHHLPTTSLESPEIILNRPGGCVQRYETGHSLNLDDKIIQDYPFYNQVRAFCECILQDSEPRITGEDGMHVLEAVVAAYVSSWKGIKIKLPFREEIDLKKLFKEIKERDKKALKYNYSIDNRSESVVFLKDPLYGFRPPRTKEKWSDAEHGMIKKGEYTTLHAHLTKKGTSD